MSLVHKPHFGLSTIYCNFSATNVMKPISFILIGLSLISLFACDKKIEQTTNNQKEENTSDLLHTPDTAEPTFPSLSPSPIELSFYDKLSNAALDRTLHNVRYDPKYVSIPYPMGDVPTNTGVCTDVVIRSYRQLGIDLQQLLHEDIRQAFNAYPSKKVWGLNKPDSNIDHRRVYNLQAFFERHGDVLPISNEARDYQPGDLVTWQISPKMPHIGIVVDVATDDPDRHMIVHNIGQGPKIDDLLFAFPITGHYRFNPQNI